MDLDELLRRHDQFKQRKARSAAPRPQQPVERPAIKPQPTPAQPPVEKPAAAAPAADMPVQPPVPAQPEPPVETAAPVSFSFEAPVQEEPSEPVISDIEPEDIAPESAVSAPQDEDFIPEDGEEYIQPQFTEDDDDDFAGDAEDEKDANPFDSMFSIFRTAFGKLRRRNAAEDDAESYDEGEDFAEDEPADPVVDDELPAEDGDEIDPPTKRRSLFSWKKKAPAEDDFIYDDSDFAEEDYVAEEFPPVNESDSVFADAPAEESEDFVPPVGEDIPEDVSAPADIPEDIPAPAADIPEDIPAPVIGIPEDVQAPAVDVFEDFSASEAAGIPEDIDFAVAADAPAAAEDVFFSEDEAAPAAEFVDEQYDGEAEDDFEDGDFADDDIDGEDAEPVRRPARKSALVRFLNLFIVREDDEDDEPYADDEDDWNNAIAPSFSEEDADVFASFDNDYPTDASEPADSIYDRIAAEFEGGNDMDEKNRVNTDMTELLAAGLESQGMSRRERRELAARMAAEEAAKRAAEEAAAAPAVTPIFAEPVEEASEPAKVEEPAAPVDNFDAADEPTRIFKPLTSIPAAPVEEPASEPDLFGDDEDDSDEEEDAAEEKPRRFGFFHKKRAAEDEEDEDDEEEDDEEDDEEEEPVEKKSRGLFSRKSRSVKYDEDEEDEEDEDEYDEDEDDDEDDEYDEYDDFDDEDDDDDYDDEDDDRPIGLRIVGFFKGLFAFILCVLVVIFALNFLDYFNVLSLDSVFEHHYNKAPAVFDTLFPSHNLKQMAAPEESITAIDPIDAEATEVPAATDAPAVG